MLSNREGKATRQHGRMNSNTVHVKSLTNLIAKDKEHGCFSPFATFCEAYMQRWAKFLSKLTAMKR
jgi:hypothetical protein